MFVVLKIPSFGYFYYQKVERYLQYNHTQNQPTMQLTINDYNFDSFAANTGWAQVEIFGKTIEFNFSCYDAITAAIELGYIEQPDDRDKDDIGYENPAFSATVRELIPSECRIAYQKNSTILSDFYATEFGLEIVSRLAFQSLEVREVIQAEALRIALIEFPAGIVEEMDIKTWFFKVRSDIAKYAQCIDFNAISEYMKQAYYQAETETLSQL